MKKSHTVQQGSHRRINDRGERREQPEGAETRPWGQEWQKTKGEKKREGERGGEKKKETEGEQ